MNKHARCSERHETAKSAPPLALAAVFFAFALFALPAAVSAQRLGYMPVDGSGHAPGNTVAPGANQAGGGFRGAFYYPLDPSGNTMSVEPNPRLISNTVFGASHLSPVNEHKVSAVVVAFGQFIAHDLVKTQATGVIGGSDVVNITAPAGDPVVNSFHGFTDGKMRFPRGLYDPATGTSANNPRVHLNFQTGWIDASTVYGQSANRLSGLRTFFRGLLIEDPVNGVPINSACLPMAGPFGNHCRQRLAGDIRANVAPGILALHGLFVKEHNRLARKLASDNPSWNDERLFQEARKRVIALMQAIHYNEYLPLLVGGGMPPYAGFNRSVDPRVDVRFAVAAYRYGHSGISSIYACITAQGEACPQGHLVLRDHYFNPSYLDSGITIGDLLRGMTVSLEAKIDTSMSWDVRNKVEGVHGNDLAVLDILRGRDFGLPTLNQARQELGLAPYASFAELTSDVRVQTALSAVYGGDVNAVELWVGGLAESGASEQFIGPTFKAIIVDQFRRLRDGDAYHYENTALLNSDGSRYLSDAEINEIRTTKLADVIARNTDWSNVPRAVMAAQPQLMLIEQRSAPAPSSQPNPVVGPTPTPSPAAGGGSPGGGAATASPAPSGKRTQAIGSLITMDWQAPQAGETSITITFTFKGMGWFGIGLGSASMIGADTIMMRHVNGRGEAIDSKANSYAMPSGSEPQDVTVVSSSQSGGQTIITIRRALNTGDSNDAVIGKGAMPCVFAWDPASTSFGYHSSNRVTTVVDFLASDSSSADSASASLEDAQQAALMSSFGVHGLTMFLVWGVLVPASALIIRFFKHIASSVIFHKFANITAATVTLPAAAAALVSTKQGVSLAHMWLGMTLSVTVAIQVVVGVALRSWLRSDKAPPSYWRGFRKFHQVVGWLQVASGLVQMYLGARILFRGYGVWIVLAWNCFLVLVFIGMTGYSEWTRDATRTTSAVVFDKDNARRLAMSQSSTSMTMAEVKELVKGGAKFVIMSGYVYDVGPFLRLHPGGAFLLERSIGSDVSQFFLGREAFDNNSPPHMHSDRAYRLLRSMCVAALKADLQIKSWAEAPTLPDDTSTDLWKLTSKTQLPGDPRRPIYKLVFSHSSAFASSALSWSPASFGRYMVVKVPSAAIEEQRRRLGLKGGRKPVQSFTTSSTFLGRLVTGLMGRGNNKPTNGRPMLTNGDSLYNWQQQQQQSPFGGAVPPGLRTYSNRSSSMPPALSNGGSYNNDSQQDGSSVHGGSAEYSQPGSVTGKVPKHIERAATQWFARSQRRLSLEHGIQLQSSASAAAARGEVSSPMPGFGLASPGYGDGGGGNGSRTPFLPPASAARIAPAPTTPGLRNGSINGPPPISFVPGDSSDASGTSNRGGRRTEERGRSGAGGSSSSTANRRSRSEEPASPASNRLPPIRAPQSNYRNNDDRYSNASRDAIGLGGSSSSMSMGMGNNNGGDTPLGGTDAMLRANKLKGQAASNADSFYGGYAYAKNGGGNNNNSLALTNYAPRGGPPPSLGGGGGISASYRPPFGPAGTGSFVPAPPGIGYGGGFGNPAVTFDLSAPGATIERPYTIVRADNKEGLILYVRHYPKGLVSSYLVNMDVGQDVLMSGPKGLGLHLDNEQGGIVVAIMQGTCAAAVFDLLQHIYAASEERKARKGNKKAKASAWSREQFEAAQEEIKAKEKAKEKERRERKERERRERERERDRDYRDRRGDDDDDYYRKSARKDDSRDDRRYGRDGRRYDDDRRRSLDRDRDRDRDRDWDRRRRSDDEGDDDRRTPAGKRRGSGSRPEVELPGSASSDAAVSRVIAPGSRASRALAALPSSGSSPKMIVGSNDSNKPGGASGSGTGRSDPLAELLLPSEADADRSGGGKKEDGDRKGPNSSSGSGTTSTGPGGVASRTSTSGNATTTTTATDGVGAGASTSTGAGIASRILRARVLEGTATEADFEAARLEASRVGLPTDVVPHRLKVGGVTITLAKEESSFRSMLRTARSRQHMDADRDEDDYDRGGHGSSSSGRRGRSERPANTRSSNPRDDDSEGGYRYSGKASHRGAQSEGARRYRNNDEDDGGRRGRKRDDDRRRGDRDRDRSFSSHSSGSGHHRRGGRRSSAASRGRRDTTRENRTSNSDSADDLIAVKRYRSRSRSASSGGSYRSDEGEGRKLLAPRSSRKDDSRHRSRGRASRGRGRRDFSSERDRSRSRSRSADDRIAVDVRDGNNGADYDGSSDEDDEAGLMNRSSSRPLSGRRRAAQPSGPAGFSENTDDDDDDDDEAHEGGSKAKGGAGGAAAAGGDKKAAGETDFANKRPRFKLVLMLVMETADCVPEADYLRFMDASLDDFELHVNVSKQANAEEALRKFPRVTFGRLTARRLERLLPPANLLTVSLCGTPTFVADVRQIFLDMGLPKTLLSVTG